MIGLEPKILDTRLFVVGKSGFGKTNVAKGSGVEVLLSKKRRVGIIDPTDSWYGLRLKPDGKRPAFKVVIFGGEHGDLPLNIAAGAAMGRALAQASDSWIISLAEVVNETDRERFCAAFLESLYAHNRAPLTLVVDEAETIAPQRTATPLQTTMVSRLNQIVKRGRRRGFVTWLISQRPADVSKAVTSQADTIVSLALSLPHDRRAIMDYVKDHDEDGTAAELFKIMPKLPRGEGIVWWPGGGILDRRKFPLTKTFDSGKTPEAGDPVASLQPLKLESLSKKLEAEIAAADATNVAKLQARIRELEKAKAPAPKTAVVELTPAKRLEIEAAARAHAIGEVSYLVTACADAVARAVDTLDVNVKKLLGKAATPAPRLARTVPAPAPIDTKRLPAVVQRKTAPVDQARTALSEVALRPGERKILTALAQYAPQEIKHSRTAALCLMTEGGGTFKTYAGQLRKLGYMTAGNPATITADGLVALGEFERLPVGLELFNHWRGQVRPGEATLLEVLRAGFDDPEEIAREANMTTGGGTYKTYMGRLRKLGLVVKEGASLRLHEDLRG